ncbi:MAG: hypothetical protein HOC71_02575 [Candidatus Latescibacteria bacterium]|jgi:hypothetical protein|nr:hypothetical protein [Candidatus Latescibacterota bacterium]
MKETPEEITDLIPVSDEESVDLSQLADPEEPMVVVRDGRLVRGRIKEKSVNILKRYFS